MKTLNLLLLEDNNEDIELIIQVIKRAGIDCNVTTACYKHEYITAITNNTYDLVLADNSLPQYNATDALALAKEHDINIPFILVTGSISEEFAVEIMRSGAWDYVLKDRLQRLPNAILSAHGKYSLMLEKQKYIDDLTKSEALMKEAERLAHFSSWEEDRVAGTVRWSEEHYRMLGYEPGTVEATIENFINKVHPEDIALVIDEMDKAFLKMERHVFNCRVNSTDSQVKYIQCELVIKRDAVGNILRINGMNRDITEARRAEIMLLKSEANLRTIFDNSDTGYILLDNEYNIVSFNKIFNNFTTEQLNKPLLEGANIYKYIKSERFGVLQEVLERSLGDETVKYELPFTKHDGHISWYSIGYHPVKSKDGSMLGIIISETDITQRKVQELQEKKMTQDLIHRKNELEQFTYIISHNLRAPVANILGISSILENDISHQEEQKNLIAGMVTSVEKLDNIIADLNQIIQQKQGIGDKKELLYFTQLVDDIKISINNIISSNGVIIKCHFDEINSMVTVRSFMHSIFFNLISNSIKYRRQDTPPTIEISTRKTKTHLELIFKDNGVGIDLEKKGNLLFGLYKRFHVELAEGKGMGLFMVKTHVESLGGTISVNSKVNDGTQFTIKFELEQIIPINNKANALY